MADVDEYCLPVVDIPKNQCLDLASIHEYVVKLNFHSGGVMAMGTGFFINIPDSPYEVILTAGHNLYTRSNTFTTQVTVLFPKPNPRSVEPYPISIPPEHIKVCAEYQRDPNNLEADYGVILIPYSGKNPRRGFGFNMTHAFAELRGEVHVSSYRPTAKPGRPVLSTGDVLAKESNVNRLVYEAKTEMSSGGAPVWIAFNDDDVAVVAIHNHNPGPGSKGCGSRLSPTVLREVFAWASLDTTKKIKAQNTSKKHPLQPPPEGLYMTFGKKPFACLQRGTGTEFDVFPAQVTSNSIQYMLALGDRWVMFDIENQQAVLVDRPREQSLFTMQRMKNSEKFPGIVYIFLRNNNYQLRMDGSKFKPHDIPDAQISGLSMVISPSIPPPFIQFTFEPYKPFILLPTAVPDS